jgi:hypothetical protein
MSERKLASVQKIVSLTPIPEADKIETARVLNWDVVVKCNEFGVGDLVVYIEIDSFVPNAIAPFLTKVGKEPNNYMNVKGEVLKTVKLRKQISQGLILPLSVISVTKGLKEGDEVTKILGIIKYDVENQEENEKNPVKSNKIFKYLMKHSWFRNSIGNRILIYKGHPKGEFPSHIISKTDETRIQGLVREFDAWKGTSNWSISEKVDGQSVTYFTETVKPFFFKKKTFGVCSRNLYLKTKENNSYWNVAGLYDIEKKLMNVPFDVAIQGEIIGGKIQGNKYSRNEYEFYVYNVKDIKTNKWYTNGQVKAFCELNGLKSVPYISFNYTIPETIDEIVKMADGESRLQKGVLREGLVIRNNEIPRISFKAISNEFLLKWGH